MRMVTSLSRQCSSLHSSLLSRHFSASAKRSTQWGFIGLGRMGYPMAVNLRAKVAREDTLHIHDVASEALDAFAKAHSNGVHIAQSAREVASKSDVVITVLPAPKHVRDVYDDMLAGSQSSTTSQTKGRLFIDCSTIDPTTSVQVADKIQASRHDIFVDAPMSGGTVAATAGTLTFMLGSAPTHVDRVTQILLMLGKRVVHLGPQTSGLKGKLANNYLLAISNIATAEAMHMGLKWGLDANALADIINTSSGRCWSSEVNNPVPGICANAPAGRDYQGGFGTSLMSKDLELAMQGAKEAGVEPRLGPLAADLYSRVEMDKELKGKDFSIVYKWLQQQTL